MAITCATLTGSRTRNCKPSIAGLRAVSFGVYDPTNRLETSATGVTDLATVYGAGTLARFAVKNTTTDLVETATKGADTNSKTVKGTMPLVLEAMPDSEHQLETSLVANTLMDREWVVFLEYRDGTIVAAGSQNGADCLNYVAQSGGTTEGLNGFTLTVTTDEPTDSRSYTLTGDALTEYAAALMA